MPVTGRRCQQGKWGDRQPGQVDCMRSLLDDQKCRKAQPLVCRLFVYPPSTRTGSQLDQALDRPIECAFFLSSPVARGNSICHHFIGFLASLAVCAVAELTSSGSCRSCSGQESSMQGVSASQLSVSAGNQYLPHLICHA